MIWSDMRVLLAAAVVMLLLAAASGLPGSVLAAQTVLPDAPGKDVTVKVCASCHAAETVASVRHTPEGWRDVIAKMVAAGAEGTEQELETVFQYLSTQFPAEAQKALNLNTATAIELESVAGLLRKEAAAVIAHREKNGPCKKLEDLKKIAGLDYKKIEARKERLACM
jgi:competence ComEA-like helix-hairpin-helix protein